MWQIKLETLFELLKMTNLRSLLIKTALLLALASVKWVSNLQASSVDTSCLEFGFNNSKFVLLLRIGTVYCSFGNYTHTVWGLQRPQATKCNFVAKCFFFFTNVFLVSLLMFLLHICAVFGGLMIFFKCIQIFYTKTAFYVKFTL